MKGKTFQIWTKIIGIGMGISSSFWVLFKHPVGLVLTIAGGSLIIVLMGLRVKDVISDERIKKIGEKAAFVSYGVYSVTISFIGALLVCFDKTPYGGTLTIIGMTLALSVAFLFLIFITARLIIQNRKVL